MNSLNAIGVIVAVTIIALAGIAMVAAIAAASLLVQSASATTDVMNTTSSVGGEEQGAVSNTTSTTTTTNNNVSNAVLGSLFLTEEAEFTNFNPINETYIEISYVGNATIMPPNSTNTINATETGNITLNIQPNGVNFVQGQGFLVTEEGDNGTQEENANTTFVELSRVGPGDTGAGTGVSFFNTNSTEQLAFLDNMLAIAHVEFSPEGSTLKIWEWKSGMLPLETGGGRGAPPATGNQTTTIISALEEVE